jgi:hypothetical protein
MKLYIKYFGPIVFIMLFVYYFHVMEFDFMELTEFLIGSIALWLPMGGLFFVLLKKEIVDDTIRVAVSALASYCLTTLAYFTFAALHATLLFYVGIVAISIFLAFHVYCQKPLPKVLVAPTRVQLALAIIIIGSLVATIPYKKLFDFTNNPDTKETVRTYRLFTDHLIHASVAYELDKHTPNFQAPYRAGTPDRAYHNFPHVTTMLLARFSNQKDMLRAHIIYHYTVIEIMFCLVIYSLVMALSASRVAGGIAASLLYIFVIHSPPMLVNFTRFNVAPESIHFAYFTLFPHASSGLELVEVSSSQMYSGVLALQGILLNILCISINANRGKRSYVLLCLTALMVASMVRFRVHIFIIIFPSFVLVMLFTTYWKRSMEYMGAAGLAFLMSAVLFAEMNSSIYLASSSALRIGFNGLALPNNGYHFNNWPFAYDVMSWMRSSIATEYVFSSSWQIISMLMFSILNVCGVLLTIGVLIFLASEPAWGEFRLLSVVVILSFIMTVFGATMLAADYDSASLGGQLPLHLRWYLLGLGPMALWLAISRVQRRLIWSRERWVLVGLVVGIAFLLGRYITLPSEALRAHSASVVISEDEWDALTYLHDQTPRESVVIMRDSRPLSGIYGRAAYYEDIGGEVFDKLALRLDPNDNRPNIIERLWTTDSIEEFCSLIPLTAASYLFDDIRSPLHVENPPCLKKSWASPRSEVMIWSIIK